jgi:TolB protein
MRGSKGTQQLILIAGGVVLALIIGVVVLMESGNSPKPVSPTFVGVAATPTGPRPECGTVVRKTNPNGSAGFPVINVSDCPPDTSRLPRGKPWTPIVARLNLQGSTAACEDWYAYHSNQTGSWEIFRLAKNSQPLNLSRGKTGTDSIAPSMSPDRRSIAFTSNRDGNWEIYVTNADASNEPQRITHNSFAVDMSPIWSPDGKRIIYESIRKGNWDLFMFDVESAEEIQITDAASNDTAPIWSPDNKKILYTSQKDGKLQIYEMDVESGAVRKLSDGKGVDTNPLYASDGKWISFTSVRDGKPSVLYTMNSDGSNLAPISEAAIAANNQSISPNNSMIVYEGTKDGKQTLFLYDMKSKQTRQMTDLEVPVFAPTWDCQSSTIVFTATVDGTANLFSAPVGKMDEPPINIKKNATQMTQSKDNSSSQYPVGAPREERASTQSITQSLSASLNGGG